MALSIPDQARALVNSFGNGQGAVNGRSQADQAVFTKVSPTVANALAQYVATTPPANVAISPAIFKPQGSVTQPNTLQGDWNIAFSNAVAAANATCTSAGASAPVTYAPTAACLAAMQARIATAQGLQASSPSVLAGLAAALTALNLAYGAGLPTQNDATALATLQASALAALTTAVTDGNAVAAYFGITVGLGGN